MSGAAADWRVAHTFSICAVDAKTGEAGVAVSSALPGVGALVPYAQPGAGAIAIQGCVVPMYGRVGLDWLARGASAADTLRQLLDLDLPTTLEDDEATNTLYRREGMTVPGQDFVRDEANRRIIWFGQRMRQVGVVDRAGRAVTHSGAHLQPVAAARAGEGYCCQGNALTGADVVEAMAQAYEKTRNTEEMAKALAAALLAGVASGGGDKRGNRAAGLLVVRDRGHWTGSDRYRDLRVDDHDRPVHELSRILALH